MKDQTSSCNKMYNYVLDYTVTKDITDTRTFIGILGEKLMETDLMECFIL